MLINITPELPTDSANYEVLTEAVTLTKRVPGMTCEIGLRRGGGSKFIMDALVSTEQKDKVHIAIDPYGNIEYADNDKMIRQDYTNMMRDEALVEMYLYCRRAGIMFMFFNLEDTEFFARYSDGVPIYQETKRIENTYSMVHFDGPHRPDLIKAEIDFFHTRSLTGATFVFDDVALYDHKNTVHPYLKELGWKVFSTTARKWGYTKA